MNNPTYELDGGAKLSIGNSIANLNFSKGKRSLPLGAKKGMADETIVEVYEPINEKELDLDFCPSPDIRSTLRCHQDKKDSNSTEVSKHSLAKNASEPCRKTDQAVCLHGCTAVKPKPTVSAKPVAGKKSPILSSVAEHTKVPVRMGGGAPVPNHILTGVPVLVNH